MDRRTIFAVIVCFFVFLFWQKLYIDPRAKVATTQSELVVVKEASAAPGKAFQPTAAAVQADPAASVNNQTQEFNLGSGSVTISNKNAAISGWKLNKYRLGTADDSPIVDLGVVTFQGAVVDLAVDSQEYTYLPGVIGSLSKVGPRGSLWSYSDDNVDLSREVSFTENQPFINIRLKATFKTKKPNYAFISLLVHSPEADTEPQDREVLYWANKEINRAPVRDAKLKDVQNGVKWVGVSSRYFVMSLLSMAGVEPRGLVQPLGQNTVRVSLVYPVVQGVLDVPIRAFFGPKDLELLRSVEPTLDHTVDFGWFTVFAYPLLKLMKFFFELFHNYGVSIILMTLVVNLLTTPLTYKSMKSMKEMAKLQPQLQKLREKYKDDKEALNREMLTMMRSHGYNPMAGCLPILVQMPIFLALYRVLYSSIELYHAPFMLWITDLSAKDPYYVTPVILTLTMYISQKLTPTTATDPTQAKMLQFMPLMFGVFMVTLPSGLGVYMLVNSLASIVRQVILNKKFDS